jgi:hypothetical protein
LAALPVLLVGAGVALVTAVVDKAGGAPAMRGVLGPSFAHSFALWAAAVMLIAACGAAALATMNRLPLWSWSWVATDFVGVSVALNLVAEERPFVISPGVDGVALLLCLLAGLTVLSTAALRGWKRCGLLSLGFSATLALSLCFWAAAGPSRYDIGLLAAPAGLLLAALVYLFPRGSGPERLVALSATGLVGVGLSWAVNRAFHTWTQSAGETSLLRPLLALTVGPPLVGPLLGLLAPRLRRALSR